MTMQAADSDLPVITSLIIEEQTSAGNTTALLQHFPLLLVPRIGEGISIAGQEGRFLVINVQHTFLMQDLQNRQGVIVTVERDR